VVNDSRTLIENLLAEQRELTAVELFSRAHDAHTVRGRRYENLLPASGPAPGQQYAFEVSLDRCSGCKACVTACHALNGLDEDETWRSVGLLVSADVRTPLTQTITTACHHCVDPGCLNGCPVLAYDKDPVTGIVKHLDDQCIGCQYCVMKCPYEVPRYSRARGIVRKCDLCSARLAVDEAPACAQACPNEAIRITLVETARVRGKYRPLSAFASPRPGHSPPANAFLPDSPDPAITLPTTRFVTSRVLPSTLEAADAHELQPSKAHPPLTVFLVLSQMGAGLALLGTVAGGSGATALAALVSTGAGMLAGALHLGQPRKAWRGFLGWRKSWFSRELIAFGAFLAALGAHLAVRQPLTAALAAMAGLAAVACSAMIYVDTRRPFWNAPMTFGRFFGTTLLLGGAGTVTLGALFQPPSTHLSAVAVLVLGVAVKLASENRIYQFLVDEQSPRLDALNKTALLLEGRFGRLSRCRVVCVMAGGIVLPLLTMLAEPRGAVLPTVAVLLCLTGELIERHLFFVAEVAPGMPGGGAA
jgi:Fe-S-cluster-containing dehydrogenase component/DMSO reductase anchor subunit